MNVRVPVETASYEKTGSLVEIGGRGFEIGEPGDSEWEELRISCKDVV